MARRLDSVSLRHLAARRSFKCGAAVATASPLTSLIWTLQWYHELSAFGQERAMPKRAEEHEREIQRFRRPPRGGAEGGRK